MKRLTITAVVFAIAALGTVAVDAKVKSVTGTWTLTVEHVGMKLTLRQKENTITGTLDWPHGDLIPAGSKRTVVFEVVPLSDVASPGVYAAKVIVLTCRANGLGAYLYWRGSTCRKALAAAACRTTQSACSP